VHLKSITLKGFKSFAKATTLNFHECVSAVVGPNGSGKSNISDAILWVLGERSAKNIRGDAMEDVIFSGAKNKGRAAMAEVSLCLDNSDSTLKIDFNDVVITRRMYRSGESDYWLNDTPVRRLDIIDILHDSGLGSGTHSIISQGSLDSVLGYDEFELRNLIDEAAGISKHKLKKEKSLKKLEKMKSNFDRISDITLEVERQLGPLKRRAKRAEQFSEISSKLDEATCKLAVDDYRRHESEKKSLNESINKKNENLKVIEKQISDAKMSIEDLTSKIQLLNEKNEIAHSRRNTISKKLNELKIISEKTFSISKQFELVFDRDEQELNDIKRRIVEDEENFKKSDLELSELSVKLDDLNFKKNKLDQENDAITKSLGELKEMDSKQKDEKEKHLTSLEENKNELAKIKATLEGKKARLEFLDNKKSEIESSIKEIQDSLEAKENSAKSLVETFKKAKDDEKNASDLLKKCMEAKSAAEESLIQAKSEEKSINTQIDALNKLASTQDVDAITSNFIEEKGNNEKLSLLMKTIHVDKSVEDIVEFLLSDYLNSIIQIADSEIDSFDIALDIKNESLNSPISLLRNECLNTNGIKEVEGARSIVDFIKVDNNSKNAIVNLIGDAYLCDSLEKCVELSRSNPNLRFLTKDGFYVGNKGDIVVDCACGDKNKGTLERSRQVEELKNTLIEAAKKVSSLEKSANDAISSLEDAQKQSLEATQFLTKVSLQVDSINSEVSKLSDQLDKQNLSYEQTLEDIKNSNEVVNKSLPDINAIEDKIKNEQELLDSINTQLLATGEKLEVKEDERAAISKQLSDLGADLSHLKERKIYLDNLQSGRKAEIGRNNEKVSKITSRLTSNKEHKVLFNDFQSVLNHIFDEMTKAFSKRNSDHDQNAKISDEMFSRVSELRESQEELYRERDLINEAVLDVKVKCATLDSEMKSLAEKIEEVSKKPLMDALLIPQIDDRQLVEKEFDDLTKKINRIGNVDYSARQEFEDLSLRYEFLCSNLDDIRSSISTIRKIDQMIDERFKQEFDQTFLNVNENFSQVFKEFFPGGSGSLNLVSVEGQDEEGIAISANPAGKKIKRISLLSGGEKSLVALSFLFAIFKTRKTPFYVLDEVEAALDDTNLTRLLAYVDKMRNSTQFIFITHQRRTMELSDVLFGVSMQEDGITKVISQRLDVALKNA
jgi:chromosome segregation protein